MKDPYSLLNTHIRTVKGIVSVDDETLRHFKETVDIRCTSDENAETLSLTAKNVQIAVRVKDIERVIAEARESRGDKAWKNLQENRF